MRLNYETYGDGHPLIILHGLFGSLENWRTMSRELAGLFRVYALDLRNHGRSPHAAAIDYPLMAHDLKEFVEEQALGSAHLLGHSMGGKVAMELALTWPELVDKLVVVDIAPREYRGGHLQIVEALLAVDLGRFSERRDVDRALAGAIPDPVTRQFLLKNLASDDAGRFFWRINLPAILQHYPRLLAAPDGGRIYGKPALFLRGEMSRYLREEDVPLITRLFPKATLVSVPNAGHWVHADAPQDFRNLVVAFLQVS